MTHPEEKCRAVRDFLIRAGLYRADDATGNHRFRIAVSPYPISPDEHAWMEALGPRLLAFYRAMDDLYFQSVDGKAPGWIAAILDQGKPTRVVASGRAARFRSHLPGVIRPDLIPTDDGMIAVELDAVPGGIGLTAALSAAYEQAGDRPLGGADGMVSGFARMIGALPPDAALAMVVSEESNDYRPEMAWLADALLRHGLCATTVAPDDLAFDCDPLHVSTALGRRRVAVLYRFFELFDLPQVPNSTEILDAVETGCFHLTPPAKAHLEEKSMFALFWHPELASFWRQRLDDETHATLSRLFPRTWLLDPAPLPPQTVIPDLTLAGRPVTDFRMLGAASQKGRRFVIKPSGFSPLAWGSRGVVIGHDLPTSEWKEAIDRALAEFSTTPHLLQPFHKGKRVQMAYCDFDRGEVREMEGRARLSPYYFVADGKTILGGILATVCPADKKRIHGMPDAVMAPCAVIAP